MESTLKALSLARAVDDDEPSLDRRVLASAASGKVLRSGEWAVLGHDRHGVEAPPLTFPRRRGKVRGRGGA